MSKYTGADPSRGPHRRNLRGSSALAGAVDCQLRVFRDADGNTCVEVIKQGDAPIPANPIVARYRLRDNVLESTTAPTGVEALQDREQRMHAKLVTLCTDGANSEAQWHGGQRPALRRDTQNPLQTIRPCQEEN
jgi:hypothetical protein